MIALNFTVQLTSSLNPSITEELYFSLDQPSISSFDPKFSVRARSEAATVASKLMEKSKLKGLVLEKEESVKKPTTAAKRKERKEKVQECDFFLTARWSTMLVLDGLEWEREKWMRTPKWTYNFLS